MAGLGYPIGGAGGYRGPQIHSSPSGFGVSVPSDYSRLSSSPYTAGAPYPGALGGYSAGGIGGGYPASGLGAGLGSGLGAGGYPPAGGLGAGYRGGLGYGGLDAGRDSALDRDRYASYPVGGVDSLLGRGGVDPTGLDRGLYPSLGRAGATYSGLDAGRYLGADAGLLAADRLREINGGADPLNADRYAGLGADRLGADRLGADRLAADRLAAERLDRLGAADRGLGAGLGGGDLGERYALERERFATLDRAALDRERGGDPYRDVLDSRPPPSRELLERERLEMYQDRLKDTVGQDRFRDAGAGGSRNGSENWTRHYLNEDIVKKIEDENRRAEQHYSEAMRSWQDAQDRALQATRTYEEPAPVDLRGAR
eukprot:NODE_844_length_1303_cov_150.244817_g620_i0.p1 GENE.NODE_844_length_1303_cov_150.244817_g620_i0~~NODE_844_length_1303_cov_150.244817_g620_i0.p1  ORF type:complete len:391 (+),score=81.67 NODE_844_length_1303_cov_150.244817_g620_i0:62-1174(+)